MFVDVSLFSDVHSHLFDLFGRGFNSNFYVFTGFNTGLLTWLFLRTIVLFDVLNTVKQMSLWKILTDNLS